MSYDINNLVDAEKLSQWLDNHVPDLGDGSLSISFLHGGTSNIILTLDRGREPAVLRCAPPQAPPNSEKAMTREARILAALNGTDVPHPHLYGFCDDLSVIGTPFYIMEKVEGWAPELGDGDCHYPDIFDNPQRRREMGFSLIGALAKLAKVDHQAIGLANFGRPGNFLERQVDRWLGQLTSYPDRYPAYEPRIFPGIDEVATWLRANVPADQKVGIVHGDFGPPNVLFDHEAPTRVCAIVDWELATIGDPVLDLALFLINLRDESDPTVIPKSSYFNPTDFPTRQELIARYADLTGWDLSNMNYYMVLAQFRMACILEYKVAAAAESGELVGTMKIFPEMVTHLMAQAHSMIIK